MHRDTQEFISETVGLICEFVLFSVAMLTIAVLTYLLGVELGRMGTLMFPEAKADEVILVDAGPIEHTTINRAEFMEEDSGDSELPLVQFANTVDRLTGWSDLSMDEQAVRVKLAGLVIETAGKMTPKNPITGGFMHSFLRQVGVQMQVQAMHHLDEISNEPAIAFVQGFLVGL